jgi:uncharacterized membrane protein
VISRVVRLGILGTIGAVVLERWLSAAARKTGRLEPGTICTSITIRAPAERVWAELVDLEGQPSWMSDLKSVRLLTPPPLGVGSLVEGDVRIFGVPVTDPVTITEFEPPHRYGIRHIGTVGGRGLIQLRQDEAGDTLVSWEEQLIAPYLPFAFRALGGPLLGRVFQADLERLKVRVEQVNGNSTAASLAP